MQNLVIIDIITNAVANRLHLGDCMKNILQWVSLILLCVLLGVAGCARQGKIYPAHSRVKTEKLTVYTTIYPVYDFAGKIGGELVEVAQIIPPGADAHNFEPSAKLLRELAQADLIIYNGANMEPWIPKVKEALGDGSVMFLNASENIPLLEFEEDGVSHDHEEAAHSHAHYGVDPHVWLSPQNAIIQSRSICNAFVEKDKTNADYYRSNYERLAAELEKLDQEYREALQHASHKNFVVAHDSFGYLAKEYGLTQIPIRGLTAEAEPSPTKLKQIISLAQKHGLKYIFYESLTDPKVSEVIAEELGVKTLELNPLGNLTKDQIKQGEDYFSVMRKNLINLRIALNEE